MQEGREETVAEDGAGELIGVARAVTLAETGKPLTIPVPESVGVNRAV